MITWATAKFWKQLNHLLMLKINFRPVFTSSPHHVGLRRFRYCSLDATSEHPTDYINLPAIRRPENII